MRSIFKFHARRPLAALVSSPFAHSRRFVSQKSSDPLRILFCGSDDFSIASLHALYDEHVKNRDFIASIDVLCRPPKRVGRGLKQFRSGREIRLNTNQLQWDLHSASIHRWYRTEAWASPSRDRWLHKEELRVRNRLRVDCESRNPRSAEDELNQNSHQLATIRTSISS